MARKTLLIMMLFAGSGKCRKGCGSDAAASVL
jgi:hypothetical protein